MSGKIAFIILVKNEEANLPQCLESIQALNADVFVIDSGSTDNSIQIAETAGAKVLYHEFKNHSDQVNWAIDNIHTDAGWIFRLDADEYLTPELTVELKTALDGTPDAVKGLEINRRYLFLGRWIKHAGVYPQWHLRLWRRGFARCEERWMDEHMRLIRGETARLKHDFVDRNNKDLTFWIEKHNWYASREVIDMVEGARSESHEALHAQAARKRWAKQSIYGHTPLFFRAFLWWIFRYFVLLGFLDGKEGLIYHFLQSFWYRFLVDAKLYERRRGEISPR